MGTLGCINDMLQRDKMNRELRKIGRERMKDTRNRLIDNGKETRISDISIEELEEIQRKTKEKEKSDTNYLFKAKLLIFGCVLLVLLFGCLLYYIFV